MDTLPILNELLSQVQSNAQSASIRFTPDIRNPKNTLTFGIQLYPLNKKLASEILTAAEEIKDVILQKAIDNATSENAGKLESLQEKYQQIRQRIIDLGGEP